ncbi:nidogen-like domain-containing protein [Paractinoplanes globisporus]|uniref:alpha-amylase n=1 Tax=Paractinoplanes globisporus TaxID=113565 RepID=A0ABW6WTG6_9ACTN|nr:nidogen-like domain-containing protein [Actinoplanes globisporus]
MLAVAPASASTPARQQDPGKPASSGPVAIPADVLAAARKGPVDVLMSVNAGEGLARIRSATRGGFDKSRRKTAGDQAAAAFGATKRTALARAGSGVHLRHDYDRLPVESVRADSVAALRALAAAPGVTGIALPRTFRLSANEADLGLIGQPAAAASGYTGAGVGVAIVDTGINYQSFGTNGPFGDCSNGPGGACKVDWFSDETGYLSIDAPDVDGHGTNVAGIVSSVAPQARLNVYRVFRPATDEEAAQPGCNGSPTTLVSPEGAVLSALNGVAARAASANIRSVNLSLGDCDTYKSDACADDPLADTMLNLRALGVLPVVAAGNDAYSTGEFKSGVSSPACIPGVLSVGAVYGHALSSSDDWASQAACNPGGAAVPDAIACFSQTGTRLDLWAPGVQIQAGGSTLSGTSQAAPHVAAAVADLVSANPSATTTQIFRALTSSGPLITDPRDRSVTRHRLDIPAAATAVRAVDPPAEVTDAGCTTNSVPANDDGSTAPVALPFVADFYGTSYSALYVNNNGNVTFTGPMSTYTPFTINADTPPIIAPFLADVDTRGTGSALVTYGVTTYGDRPAFCVNWNGVGYYSGHADKTNSFQLLLVDRGDVGAGDFDIVMNYNGLTWETGDASGGENGYGGTPAGAGFSAGDGDASHFFQFPGSLGHLALLDTNAATGLVNGRRGTLQTGRYLFDVRNGAPPGSGVLTGYVRDGNGSAQASSPVQACPETGSCVVGLTGADGHYTIVGVRPGAWRLTALPPAGSSLLAGHAGPLTVATGTTVSQDLVLGAPQAPPAGTTITNHGSTSAGLPVLYWHDPLTLDTTGCAGGTATYVVRLGGTTVRSGALSETSAGHYQGAIEALYPNVGNAEVTITVTCPGGGAEDITFSVYIDPSGTVRDTAGNPIEGATVTLLRADTASGPFAAVPNGSAVMSPSNRANPWTTGSDGTFHWDVLAGFYRLQASKAGCHAPGSADDVVLSPVYEVPPPRDNLELVLDCGAAPAASTIALNSGPAVVGQAVTLAATVSAGDARPTGTVAFSAADGSVTGCAAQAITDGQATCTVTFAHAGAKQITAKYSGSAAYATSTVTGTVTVGRGTPVVTWNPPAALTYPAALGGGQLNATANVPGSFSYAIHGGGSAAGAVLHAGAGQLIDATFTPTAGGDYESVVTQVAISVLPGTQTITFGAVPADWGSRSGFSVSGLATASSGLPVAFSGSGACTVTPGGDVTVTGVGTCTLTAAQAGNADYQAAAPVVQVVSVGNTPTPPTTPTNPPATTITLNASVSRAAALRPVSLAASASLDVSGTGQSIVILDRTDNDRVVGRCTTGSVCVAKVSAQPGVHRYVARVDNPAGGGATSNEVSVRWTAPAVAVAASTTRPKAGAPVTITAVTDVDLAAGHWALRIVDTRTGHVVAQCSRGSRCSVTVAAPSARTYRASIVTSAGRAVAGSPTPSVKVNWPALTAKLTVTDRHPSKKSFAVLIGTSNGPVASAGYALFVVDVTKASKPVVLARCLKGTVCAAVLPRYSGTHRFEVRIALPNGTGVVSRSGLSVTRS